jgi:FdhD protein
MSDFQNSEHLPQEALVKLILSSGLSTTLICTPHHLSELVTGWMFSQGLINGCNHILSLQVCDFNTRVLVQVRPECAIEITRPQMLSSSGCSGGKVLESTYMLDNHICQSDLTVTISFLTRSIEEMYQAAFRNVSPAGLHCAAIICKDDSGVLIADCDVGRHNAVDKVIGAGLVSAAPFDRSVLVTSGRVSSDMVLKAARAGIPIVATRRSVTSLAAELALKKNITVVGRLTRGEPLIVGNLQRILD